MRNAKDELEGDGTFASPNDLPRIIYIAGYGRSGSTLLDLILGNHPEVLGTGEVHNLFADVSEGLPCSCGVAYRTCPVWGPTLESVTAQFPGRSMSDLAELTLTAQRTGSKRASTEFRRLWQALFATLRKVTGRTVIVDSSKSTLPARHRRRLLEESCDLETQVIHLVRHPQAILRSAARGSNRRIEAGLPPRVLEEPRALVNWALTNRRVDQESRKRAAQTITVRYEDLIENPRHELLRTGEFIGLDLTNVIEILESEGELGTGHGVSGNRLRRSGPVVFRPDREWRTKPSRLHQMMAWAAWPVSKKYGYTETTETS